MSGAAETRRRPWLLRDGLAIVVALGLGATLLGVWSARRWQADYFQDRLTAVGMNIGTDLEVQVHQAGGFVEALAAFFENSTEVTEAEFTAFVESTAAKWPGMFSACWQRYVPADGRAAFEAQMRAQGRPGFSVVDSDGREGMVPAPAREFHLPITYVYGGRGRTPPAGLDLAMYPAFMTPKWEALERGAPATSAFIELLVGAPDALQSRTGFVINAPVLARRTGDARSRLRGFVSAVFVAEPMLAAAVQGCDLTGLRVALVDRVADAPRRQELAGPAAEAAAAVAAGVAPHRQTIRLPMREAELQVVATEAFVHGPLAMLPAGVGLGGLALTAVVVVVVAQRARERLQRRLRDAERRAGERKFHEVVENMAGAVAVFAACEQGARFVVWDLNAAALALARPDCPNIIGLSLEEVFGSEWQAPVHDAMRRAWASGHAEKLPPFALTRDGVVRWLACNVFRLSSGEVVAVFNDLTAQKEVEQELRQARAELEVALDASRVGLWSWDCGLARARLDRRAAAILDVGSTEFLRDADLGERLHADDLAHLRAEAKAATSQSREFECEVRSRARDGSWRRLALRARPAGGPDGSVRVIVGCILDSTTRRRLEESVHQRQRMESIATLAGGIVHDLNNALAPLSMGLDLLRERSAGDAEAAETLQTMTTSTRKAAAVVKQLSGLIVGGAPEEARVAPRLILDGLREQLRDACPPGVAVNIVSPVGSLPDVRAGGKQLQQILQNLCVNAREAMQGRGVLTVESRVIPVTAANGAEYPELSPGSYVAFDVRDTGPGIPEAIRDRVFDPFFTTKQAGRGAGLGLSTALTIARSCHGTIRLDSREGEGTCFCVLIPAAAAKVASIPAPARMRPTGSPTLRGRCVLLADDDPMVREVARRVLEHAGMKVITAGDGREAVAAFSEQPDAIDLVVLDLVMPEVDGATAGATIRSLRPDLPILGASGYTADDVLAQARDAGFNGFLPKPYTMDGLLEAVRGALKRPVGA